jgi:hypothetical protein
MDRNLDKLANKKPNPNQYKLKEIWLEE